MIPHKVIKSNKIMKKTLLAILLSTLVISCDKNTIQQTTDSIKSADSLFTKANDGLKTLDSITKTINDSSGIANKVLIPEIQKQKKVIDSTIKTGGYQIDSINKEIEKITKQVVVGTDVVKTLDSANESIKNGESAIKVLTKTADKILNQTKRQTLSPKPSSNTAERNQNNTVIIPPVVERNPLVKKAKIEIEVENLQTAKSLLQDKIRENDADLVTENYSQTEGFQREYVTVKVPLNHFDQLVDQISTNIGDLKTKELSAEGIDYVSGQMGDVEITLVQNDKLAGNTINKSDTENEPNTFGSKSSNAFMDGFAVLGTVLLALLPFWPLFLIGGLIWYFVRRNKRNKEQKSIEMMTAKTNQEPNQKLEVPTEIIETPQPENSDHIDYSKYLPKE